MQFLSVFVLLLVLDLNLCYLFCKNTRYKSVKDAYCLANSKEENLRTSVFQGKVVSKEEKIPNGLIPNMAKVNSMVIYNVEITKVHKSPESPESLKVGSNIQLFTLKGKGCGLVDLNVNDDVEYLLTENFGFCYLLKEVKEITKDDKKWIDGKSCA